MQAVVENQSLVGVVHNHNRWARVGIQDANNLVCNLGCGHVAGRIAREVEQYNRFGAHLCQGICKTFHVEAAIPKIRVRHDAGAGVHACDEVVVAPAWVRDDDIGVWVSEQGRSVRDALCQPKSDHGDGVRCSAATGVTSLTVLPSLPKWTMPSHG